ncbi:MAG: TlpA disulfide reductase family protein [SAR86 cluster bacterium]|jgi:thiol-disulfide isomerase/thioredoxin|nr:TlpA disulfide reductase family protein [SAR86 cluster bacterium]|tara:strand:- start:3386 stop:3853 length:468 start_codon:yes stop_codon:yes gene_type:complete
MYFFKLSAKFTFLLIIGLFYSCSEPDYRLLDGKNGSLEDFKDKWLVINYWADWCPPCIKEMPELESFYNANQQEVLVLAHNFDQLEGEELNEQILRFKVNIPSLLTDPKDLFGWPMPESLPATYFIDPNGEVKEVLIGPQTRESLEAILKKLKVK